MVNLVSVAEISGPTPGRVHPRLIDVRTPSEFSSGHIAGAVNIPLDQIESCMADLPTGGPIVLICKSGLRARMAANLLAPCRNNTTVLDGGMDSWYRAGNSVVVASRTRWSLERQVRLVAGLLVLAGVAATLKFHPRWILLSGFIGLGLTFAGLTDFCPMGVLLSHMPWNKKSKLQANREANDQACVLKG
jgi:rhodanese-related sulfurtransferase